MLDLKGKMTPHQYMLKLDKVPEQMTDTEISQFILYMRDELYDNKLKCSPVTLNYLSSIAYRMADSNNRQGWASEMGTLGGTAKTEAKSRASRENGKKGGRPKKNIET